MKPFFVVAVIGSALVTGGIFLVGDFSVASVTSPEVASVKEPVQLAAANERTVTLQVENMYCASCPYIVKQSLMAVPGVFQVLVSLENETAIVTFDSAQTNVAALTDATFDMGYPSEVKNH